jgi:methyl-accepting chemotaxis protein
MASFKRYIRRTKETFSEKFGKADKTINEEYDTLVRRFESVTTASVNYNKHVQQFVENFHSMTTIMTFLAEDMTDLNKNTQDTKEREMAQNLMQVAQDCEVKAVKPFVSGFIKKS